MTKKDYERAAKIVQGWATGDFANAIVHATDAFCALFRDDNPRFDEYRFRAACIPGSNMYKIDRRCGYKRSPVQPS